MSKPRSVKSYQREIRLLRNWLAGVQWVQPIYNGAPSCSGCGEMKHLHANADCGLTALLARKPQRQDA